MNPFYMHHNNWLEIKYKQQALTVSWYMKSKFIAPTTAISPSPSLTHWHTLTHTIFLNPYCADLFFSTPYSTYLQLTLNTTTAASIGEGKLGDIGVRVGDVGERPGDIGSLELSEIAPAVGAGSWRRLSLSRTRQNRSPCQHKKQTRTYPCV